MANKEMENNNRRKYPIKRNIQIRPFAKFFLQINKKRIIFNLVVGSLIFIFISAFLMTWNVYQINSFSNHVNENSNWASDQRIGAYSCQFTGNLKPDFQSNLLSKVSNEIENKFDHIIPGLAVEGLTSSSLNIQLFQEGTSNPYFGLTGFGEIEFQLVASNIAEGRFPTNYSEIIYYKAGANSNQFQINDIVSLYAIRNQPDYKQNFTIVGIVENLEKAFVEANRSSDILSWEKYIDSENFDSFYTNHKLFTTEDYFFDIVNSYPEIATIIGIAIDFIYDSTAIKFSKIPSYITKFEKTRSYWHMTLSDLYGNQNLVYSQSFSWNTDILDFLIEFNSIWLRDTVRNFALAIPLISILIYFSMAIFSLEKNFLNSTFKLFKKQGLEGKNIRKILLLENLILSGACLLIGIVLGVILSAFSLISFGHNVNFIAFLGGIFKPLLFYSLLIYSILFFSSGYLSEVRILNKSSIVISQQHQNLRKRIFKKLVSIEELITIIPGLFIFGFGVIGLLFVGLPDTAFNETQAILQTTLVTSTSLFFIGIILVTFSLSYLLSRVLIIFTTFFSKMLWKIKRNPISLSLKNLASDSINYRQLITIILMSGICIIPGLTFQTSLNNHVIIEANLQSGFADIIIPDWNFNTTIFEGIENIPNVELTTEVTTYKLEYNDDDHFISKKIVVNILAIKDPINFSKIINYEKFEKEIISEEEIQELVIDNTYLMNTEYASKNNFDEDSVLFNSHFCDVFNEFPLTFVGSFQYFPLIQLQDTYYPLFNTDITFSLVTNTKTASQVEFNAKNTKITKSNLLLIKTKDQNSIRNVQLILSRDYDITALSNADYNYSNVLSSFKFTNFILILTTIFTILLLLLYGYTTSSMILSSRNKIIEIEYQTGVSKKLLGLGFASELFFISFVPLLMSVLISFPIINLIENMFIIQYPVFKKFELFTPIWIYVLTFGLEFIAVYSSWITNLIHVIKNYHPEKQE